MATTCVTDFLRRLTRGMAAGTLVDESDQQLVERALAGPDEVAIQAMVQRHGAMVYRVCWRVLQHPQDAEDAFQATFLVLAQKLRSVRKHASLASWLHGVGYRIALKAKAQAAARRRHESQRAPADATPPDDVTWKELRSALDDELARLPEHWRLPLVLCYLEGRTQDEAAGTLGWSKSTLRRRLREARETLASRLNRRGVVWSAALAGVLFSDCLVSTGPAHAAIAATVDAAAAVAAGKTLAMTTSAKIAALTQGAVKAMFMTKFKAATGVLLAAALVATGTSAVSFPTLEAGPIDQGAVAGNDESKQVKDTVLQDKGRSEKDFRVTAGEGLRLTVQEAPTKFHFGVGADQKTTIKQANLSYTFPFALPSAEEILQALPKGKPRPKDARIHCELIAFQVDEPRFFPLVGRASLAHAHFKCTVSTDQGSDVVYIDRDHLITTNKP